MEVVVEVRDELRSFGAVFLAQMFIIIADWGELDAAVLSVFRYRPGEYSEDEECIFVYGCHFTSRHMSRLDSRAIDKKVDRATKY